MNLEEMQTELIILSKKCYFPSNLPCIHYHIGDSENVMAGSIQNIEIWKVTSFPRTEDRRRTGACGKFKGAD